jgi:threonine dehydrogenase-like Zn-dependent dehydrogenase
VSVRAAVMHAPGRLGVEVFSDPEPGPGAIVLRMDYSGICGTDKHTWRGESIQYAGTDHERTAAYPLICGHENVGVIEAIGPGDPPLDEAGRTLAVGDRVVPAPNVTCGRCLFCLGDDYPYYLCAALEDYGNSLSCAQPPHLLGGWSELMYLLPGTRVFRVPDELPSELAALTEVMAVTHGLDTARLLAGTGGGFRFGDTVLVIGAGPLGLMHLAKAELLGAGQLIAVDVMVERLAHASAFGADLVLDARATTADERAARVRDATNGVGADIVVDCSGRAEPFIEALELARPGGTVIEAGAFVDLGPVPVNPNRHVCVRGLTVLGIGGETALQYAPALRMLARHQNRLPFRQAITHRVSLDEVADALELAQTGAAMKILVAPNGGTGERPLVSPAEEPRG